MTNWNTTFLELQNQRKGNYVFEEIYIFEAAWAWDAWCSRAHAMLHMHASTHTHTHTHTNTHTHPQILIKTASIFPVNVNEIQYRNRFCSYNMYVSHIQDPVSIILYVWTIFYLFESYPEGESRITQLHKPPVRKYIELYSGNSINYSPSNLIIKR